MKMVLLTDLKYDALAEPSCHVLVGHLQRRHLACAPHSMAALVPHRDHLTTGHPCVDKATQAHVRLNYRRPLTTSAPATARASHGESRHTTLIV
jgi:hypothetical protein